MLNPLTGIRESTFDCACRHKERDRISKEINNFMGFIFMVVNSSQVSFAFDEKIKEVNIITIRWMTQ